MRQVNQCLDLICRSGRHHGVTRKAGNTTLAFFAKPLMAFRFQEGERIWAARELSPHRAPTLFFRQRLGKRSRLIPRFGPKRDTAPVFRLYWSIPRDSL